MQQLFPIALADVDPAVVYVDADRRPHSGRPWVVANMIASADGSTVAGDGRSGGLGGPADRQVFTALRAVPDVILVAAGTVRSEGYGTVTLPEERRAERLARGQRAVPAIAVASMGLDLDWASPLFAAAEERPVVVTSAAAPPDRVRAAREVADVVVAGEERVDLADAVAALGDRGAGIVLCEGGPSLLSQVAGAGVLDELCLTLAPRLVGGAGTRIVHGPTLDLATLELVTVLEEDGFLLLRYRVPASTT